VAVVAGEGEDLGGEVFGEAVGEAGAVGVQDFGDAGDLGGGLGSGASVFAGNEDVHVAAAGDGGGDGVEGGALEAGVVVFGNDECGHGALSVKVFVARGCSRWGDGGWPVSVVERFRMHAPGSGLRGPWLRS
jgi:hypothetical protein